MADQPLHAEVVPGEGDLAGLDLREVENIGQHAFQQAAGRHDQFGQFPTLGGGLLAGQRLGNGDDAIQRRAQFVAHIGQEAGFLGIGAFELSGAFADPVLQRGQHGLGLLPLGAERGGQHADLVLAALDIADIGTLGVAGFARGGQALDRAHDAAAGEQHDGQGLDRRGQAADQQHPGGRLRGRSRHIGLRIGQQQVPVGAVQAAESDDLAAVRAGDYAVLALVGGDPGDQSGQREFLLVVRQGLFRALGLIGEARIGDQLALRGDDQRRGARRRALQRGHEEVGQLHGGAEGAHIAAVHIGRRQAGGGQPLAHLVLDQPLQIGAAGRPGRIELREGDAGHLLLLDRHVVGRLVAVVHQVIGPVGAVHHQPRGLGREEVEVVVFAARGLTEVRDQPEGRHQGAQFVRRSGFGLRDIGAEAVGVVAVVDHAVEVLVAAAAGAVGLQRKIAIGEPGHVGVRHMVHPPLQLGFGGLVQGRKVGELAVHIGAALPDIVREIADLTVRQLALEHHEGAEGAEHRHDQRHQADTDQEPARKRLHWMDEAPTCGRNLATVR